MQTARCPACGAAAAVGAPWCTLCYTDLRPAPEPVAAPDPVTAPAAVPVPAGVAAPAAGGGLAPHPILDAPHPLAVADAAGTSVATAPPTVDPDLGPRIQRGAEPAWPCLACGTLVPMAEDACRDCGRPFLPPDGGIPALSLPVIGDMRRLDKTERALVVVGGMMLVTMLVVALAFVGGSIL